MTHRFFKAWPAGCALAFCLVALAADPLSIDIKPGLWEMADGGSKVSGQVPDEMLEGIPPAQREKVKAHMLESFTKRESKADKNCITEADLKKGFEADDRENCKVLSKTVTASGFVVAESCHDERGQTTIKASFQRLSREQIAGKVTIAMQMGSQTLTVEQTLNGKWLSASCGSEAGKKWSAQ